MTTTYKFKKNPQFDQMFQEQLVKYIEAIGVAISDQARFNCPVDTGNMRSKIKFETDNNDLKATIGTEDVDYAIFVHQGTRKQSPQPFLVQALDEILGRIG